MSEKQLVLCSQGMYYTGAEEGENESVTFTQSYPHPILGHTTEKVMIRNEDIPKVVEFLQGFAEKTEFSDDKR